MAGSKGVRSSFESGAHLSSPIGVGLGYRDYEPDRSGNLRAWVTGVMATGVL